MFAPSISPPQPCQSTRTADPAVPLGAGDTASERRWFTEYDYLLRARRDIARRQVLRRVMIRQRKAVWRAAQRSP